jgi:hypothetical protein
MFPFQTRLFNFYIKFHGESLSGLLFVVDRALQNNPHTHTLTHIHTITTTATKALLAALRCVVVAIWVCLFRGCDLAIVDIVSLPVVVFAIFRVPVLFYCHFPDKTLE